MSSYIDVDDDSSTAEITINLLDGYENSGDMQIYRYSRGKSVENLYSKYNLKHDEIEFKLNNEYMIDIIYIGAQTFRINSRLSIEWSVSEVEDEDSESIEEKSIIVIVSLAVVIVIFCCCC